MTVIMRRSPPLGLYDRYNEKVPPLGLHDRYNEKVASSGST